jgi:serine/threonine protein kinase
VVAYVLLCGFPPFNAGTESLTYNAVREGNVKFPSPAWDKISPDAERFVKRLLDKDPEERPSAAEALVDPWVNHEKVNPFKKLWHGTFLSLKSPEAEEEVDKEIDMTGDAKKQKSFQDMLEKSKSQKIIAAKKRYKFKPKAWTKVSFF